MPIHDWTRVSDGTYHDFHCTWIPDIKRVLNAGLLPPGYYAQIEQTASGMTPDVLTLEGIEPSPPDPAGPGGSLAIAFAPPKVRFTAALEREVYATRRRTLAVRHSSDDRVVALIEILSPGNKSSRAALRQFLRKAVRVLRRGIHLLVVDLYPPTKRDPQGIHGILWSELGDPSYVAPPDKPLTLAAYSAGVPKMAYVEPAAVGDPLTAMPLFLTADEYVSVPLEETYQTAYQTVPRRWRAVLDAPPG